MILAVLLAVSALVVDDRPARPTGAVAAPCNQDCYDVVGGQGQVIGYACGPGTLGFGCWATTWTCFINVCRGHSMVESPQGHLVGILSSQCDDLAAQEGGGILGAVSLPRAVERGSK